MRPKVEPVKVVARPTMRLRANNETLLNEIVNMIFPNNKDVVNINELNLRLHLVVGILKKNGYGQSHALR